MADHITDDILVGFFCFSFVLFFSSVRRACVCVREVRVVGVVGVVGAVRFRHAMYTE